MGRSSVPVRRLTGHCANLLWPLSPLNKDKGTIDPALGAGATERGKINDNFRHAVEAAIADSQDKWATLKEQLVLTYGPSRGTLMICALTRDKPMKAC